MEAIKGELRLSNNQEVASHLSFNDANLHDMINTHPSSSAIVMESVELSFMFMILALTLLLAFTNQFVHKISKTKRVPPGPRHIPIFGCLFQILMNKPSFRWIHKVMNEMNTSIACFRLGNVHVITVKSPELAREFLKKQDDIFSSRPRCMSGRLVSNGYMTAAFSPEVAQWKKMRRVITNEVLSPARHRLLHDKRIVEADRLVWYVLNQVEHGNGVINVRMVAQHYCGNLIRRLIFGMGSFGNGDRNGGLVGMEDEEQVSGLFTILSYLYGFSISDHVSWLEIFDFDGHARILKRAIESVRKYQDPVIDERVRMWKKGMKLKEDDILDVLINLKDSNNDPLLNVEEIKAEIVEIMLAVVDNPSNATEWAIAEMINQPHILERAQEELDNVVGRDRLVQESDLSKLNYIKACAKEAFRLHPIAPFNLPHVSTDDTTLSGYFIPKGSRILLSRLGLGQNPKVWNEPLMYMPERHISDKGLEVVLANIELSMISFSTGRRGCPAVSLGTTTTIMLLARLIQGFSWSAPNNEHKVELLESINDMSLANPLHALAQPRLNALVYSQLQNY